MRPTLWAGSALLCALMLAPSAPRAAQPPSSSALPTSTIPVAVEHRYRMAAKIRPLLLFWIGRDNVGGTRIVWRSGENGARGWEMLIGSDPDRAPAHVNRWGFIREEQAGATAAMIGVMKQSDEQSLDQARSRTESESREGYVFKYIRAEVQGGQLTAVTKSRRFTEDYTYRDLAKLFTAFDSPVARVSSPKQMRVPSGTKPGFLTAVADLIHDTVTGYRSSGSSALKRRTSQFAYNGLIYQLTLDAPRVMHDAQYGGRTYATLLNGDFEERNPSTGGKESFSIAWGIDGAIVEVPVFISYQPRWWFKAELVLDENEKF